MRYIVRHRTVYDYSEAVAESHHLARLHPRTFPGQTCLEYRLIVTPPPAVWQEREDAFGNAFTFFAMQAPHDSLTVESESLIENSPPAEVDTSTSPPWESVAEALREDEEAVHLDAQPFRYPSPNVPVSEALADYARGSFTTGRPLLEAARDLTKRIFKECKFDPAATTVATPVETVLKERRGVCQDFAHLGIACLRSLGLSARYVSGYLETLPPPGKPRLVGSDASHAWLAVYCPVHGWVQFDPTNNCIPSTRHIITAWGRDYSDVSPLRGVIFGGGEHELDVNVDVLAQG